MPTDATPLARCLPLAAALAACAGLAAPAQAQDNGSRSLIDEHGWRLVPLTQMLEQSQRQYMGTRGMPRLLPLAMLPMQQSALWVGLSTPRADASRERTVQIELRWSIPLDRIGGAIEVPSLSLRRSSVN
jgi:hypothetical protein